ncbi:legumain-like [Clarias gariepinus]
MENKGKQWVLLAAGSKDWENYRHQADVCHAYQVVHRNGIPDEQIVVMMYDDIAYNPLNPVLGNIINERDGPNVYLGVPKDYTGKDVSADNFLAILSGNEPAVKNTGPKKVIQSGENDTIFIYLVDHGGQGVFHFPDSTLHAHDLIKTVHEMVMDHKFSKKRKTVDEALQKIAELTNTLGALTEKREVSRTYELKVIAEHFRENLFDWHKEPATVSLDRTCAGRVPASSLLVGWPQA